MDKLHLLWVDLTAALKEAELPYGFADHCEIEFCPDVESLDERLSRSAPGVICFDFDYPDRAGLRLLRDSKLKHPSLPIIMLTLQHSESLAIWAFRTKVWDYIVKPIPKYEVDRCLNALLRISAERRSQPKRLPAIHGHRIPAEISLAPKSNNSALAPAIYYVERYFRSKFRNDDVAKLCGMSPFRFSRAFKDTYGVTFRDFIVGYRLQEACRLLENPAASVTEVAYAVGFNDASYFTRIFKQRLGIPPSMVVGRSVGVRTQTPRQGPSLPEIVLRK